MPIPDDLGKILSALWKSSLKYLYASPRPSTLVGAQWSFSEPLLKTKGIVIGSDNDDSFHCRGSTRGQHGWEQPYSYHLWSSWYRPAREEWHPSLVSLRLTEIKWLHQGHTISKWQDWNLICWTPKALPQGGGGGRSWWHPMGPNSC